MSIYTIENETELAGGSLADGDSFIVYDLDALATKRIEADSIRQYVGGGVVELTASDAITPAEHGNREIALNALAGLTATLPAATGTGDSYKFTVSVTVTSNDYIIQVANATDEFVGALLQTDTDTSDALVSYPCLDGDGFDTVTLNGSTKGGLMGDQVIITDVAAGKFAISGHVLGTGTVVTPLSAAVS